MPALRQMSATGTPSPPCFRMNAFCASENLDAFIVFRSSQPGNQTRKTLVKNGPVCWEQITEGISGHDCGFDQRCARRSAYRIRVQSVRFNLHAQNRWAPLPSASEYWAEVFRAGEKA